MEKSNIEKCLASVVLRVAIASLFVAAVAGKYIGGFEGVVQFFQNTFKDSWIPLPLVTLQGRITPIIETIIPIWLILGLRLKIAWAFTAFFLTTLAFGMAAVGEYGTASNNYMYVLICVAGLYFGQFDKLTIDGLIKKGK